MNNGMPSTPRATHCYASGWRPEAALKQVATDMIAIIFDASASVDDCRMAAGTLVEAVYPEIMPAPFDLRAGPSNVQSQDEANARLISAAPDLAEALRILYDFQNGPPLEKYRKQWNDAMKLAKAALAKAGSL